MKKKIQQSFSFLLSLTMILSLIPNVSTHAASGKFASNNYYIGSNGPAIVDTTLNLLTNQEILDAVSNQTSESAIQTELNKVSLDSGGIEADLVSDTRNYTYSTCLAINTGSNSFGTIYLLGASDYATITLPDISKFDVYYVVDVDKWLNTSGVSKDIATYLKAKGGAGKYIVSYYPDETHIGEKENEKQYPTAYAVAIKVSDVAKYYGTRYSCLSNTTKFVVEDIENVSSSGLYTRSGYGFDVNTKHPASIVAYIASNQQSVAVNNIDMSSGVQISDGNIIDADRISVSSNISVTSNGITLKYNKGNGTEKDICINNYIGLNTEGTTTNMCHSENGVLIFNAGVKQGKYEETYKKSGISIPINSNFSKTVEEIESDDYLKSHLVKTVVHNGNTYDCTNYKVTYTCPISGHVVFSGIVNELHAYNEGKVTKKATHDETGILHRTCTHTITDKDGTYTCSGVIDETIPENTSHEWKTEIITKPDCKTETNGQNKRTCLIGGEVEYDDVPYEHTWETVIIKEATCEEDGLQNKRCKVCGKVVNSETIPATGHTPVDVIDVEANHQHTGKKHIVCSVCEKILEENIEIPIVPHEFDKKVTKSPTCTEKGIETWTCTVCGHVETHDIESTAHQWDKTIVQPTCTEDGYEAVQCRVCKIYKSYEVLPKLGHDWQETVIKEPDCTHTGLKSMVCTRCHESKDSVVILAKGHSWSEDITTPATCTHIGSVYKVCRDCGEEITQIIPKLEHRYELCTDDKVLDKYNGNKEATCTETGRCIYQCVECGDVKIDTISKKPHEYHKVQTLQEPTYTTEGIDLYECITCGASKQVKTEKLVKDMSYLNTKEQSKVIDTLNQDDVTSQVDEINAVNSKDELNYNEVLSTVAEIRNLISSIQGTSYYTQINKKLNRINNIISEVETFETVEEKDRTIRNELDDVKEILKNIQLKQETKAEQEKILNNTNSEGIDKILDSIDDTQTQIKDDGVDKEKIGDTIQDIKETLAGIDDTDTYNKIQKIIDQIEESDDPDEITKALDKIKDKLEEVQTQREEKEKETVAENTDKTKLEDTLDSLKEVVDNTGTSQDIADTVSDIEDVLNNSDAINKEDLGNTISNIKDLLVDVDEETRNKIMESIDKIEESGDKDTINEELEKIKNELEKAQIQKEAEEEQKKQDLINQLENLSSDIEGTSQGDEIKETIDKIKNSDDSEEIRQELDKLQDLLEEVKETKQKQEDDKVINNVDDTKLNDTIDDITNLSNKENLDEDDKQEIVDDIKDLIKDIDDTDTSDKIKDSLDKIEGSNSQDEIKEELEKIKEELEQVQEKKEDSQGNRVIQNTDDKKLDDTLSQLDDVTSNKGDISDSDKQDIIDSVKDLTENLDGTTIGAKIDKTLDNIEQTTDQDELRKELERLKKELEDIKKAKEEEEKTVLDNTDNKKLNDALGSISEAQSGNKDIDDVISDLKDYTKDLEGTSTQETLLDKINTLENADETTPAGQETISHTLNEIEEILSDKQDKKEEQESGKVADTLDSDTINSVLDDISDLKGKDSYTDDDIDGLIDNLKDLTKDIEGTTTGTKIDKSIEKIQNTTDTDIIKDELTKIEETLGKVQDKQSEQQNPSNPGDEPESGDTPSGKTEAEEITEIAGKIAKDSIKSVLDSINDMIDNGFTKSDLQSMSSTLNTLSSKITGTDISKTIKASAKIIGESTDSDEVTEELNTVKVILQKVYDEQGGDEPVEEQEEPKEPDKEPETPVQPKPTQEPTTPEQPKPTQSTSQQQQTTSQPTVQPQPQVTTEVAKSTESDEITVDKSIKVNKPTIKKISNRKGKKLLVQIKKQKGITFIIEVSTSKKFTKQTTKIAKSKKTSVTVKGLKKGKTYYVRVKAQKDLGKNTIALSKYSKVKKIKIKK